MSERALFLWLICLAGPLGAQSVPDPTRPPAAAASVRGGAAASGPRLQSTLIGPGRRAAVIDGEWVHEGDRIDAGTILSIEPGRVRLRAGTGEIELTLSFVSESSGASR